MTTSQTEKGGASAYSIWDIPTLRRTAIRRLNRLDVAEDRFLIGVRSDKDSGAFVQIDLRTGNRTVLSAGSNSSHNQVGAGPVFSFPKDILVVSGEPMTPLVMRRVEISMELN